MPLLCSSATFDWLAHESRPIAARSAQSRQLKRLDLSERPSGLVLLAGEILDQPAPGSARSCALSQPTDDLVRPNRTRSPTSVVFFSGCRAVFSTRMQVEQREPDGQNSNGNSSSGSSWWRRHKRRPAREAAPTDEQPDLSGQLLSSSAESKGKSSGGNSNNGTAAQPSNNSQRNKKGTRSRSRERTSYSKIFSQYLPASLSANNTRQPNDAAEQSQEQRQSDNRQQASQLRVVSALSRFSGRKITSLSSNQSNSQLVACDQSQLCELQKHKDNIKRRGFLHLKKPRETTFDIVQRSSSELVTRIINSNIDRNNNNNNDDDYENYYDQHKARLIEDSDPDSDHNRETCLSRQQQRQGQESSGKMKPRGKKSEQQRESHGPLLTAALLVAIGLIVVCAIKSTSALQSPQAVPPPFVGGRSQQPTSGGINVEVSPSSRPLPQPAAGSLVASVNCNKIRGHVTLTPNLQGGTSVSAQISAGPPGEFYQWSVHQFPVKPGAAMCSCSALILGSKLIDMSQLHGNLPSEQEQNVQSSINLFGPDSPVGHSLMLRGLKTGVVACATFLPTR